MSEITRRSFLKGAAGVTAAAAAAGLLGTGVLAAEPDAVTSASLAQQQGSASGGGSGEQILPDLPDLFAAPDPIPDERIRRSPMTRSSGRPSPVGHT